MDGTTEEAVLLAQKGDTDIRERLIKDYKDFIIRTTRNICKRHIEWSDDEASIGLIAFNEAIDRFSKTFGKSFDNYAFMLIRSRLIDEFRRDKRIFRRETLTINGNEEFEYSSAEIASAVEVHQVQQAGWDLAMELQRFDQILQEYGISMEELEQCSPDHSDTRVQLIRIAKEFTCYPNLLLYLTNTKRLPIKEMLKYVKVSRKTLERHRKYLISLILIYSSGEFGQIRNSISFAEIGE